MKIDLQEGGRATALEIASHELAIDRYGSTEAEARAWIDNEAKVVMWDTGSEPDYNIGYLAGLHQIARAMGGDDGGWPSAVEAMFTIEATNPDDRRSCGCPADYHMADCPLITDRHDDPPEPDDEPDPRYPDDYDPDYDDEQERYEASDDPSAKAVPVYVPESRRRAVVSGARDAEHVSAYLPANYRVTGHRLDSAGRVGYLIEGTDVAGWTLDGYVIPRLGSGMLFAKETT